MKPFLVLQLRPEEEASDDEYRALLDKGGLDESRTRRIRLEREELPELDLAAFAGVIVGGGPGCVSDPEECKSPIEKHIQDEVMSLMPAIIANDVPFLGCCYGIGILAYHLGAAVSKEQFSEPVSIARVAATAAGRADPLLAGVNGPFDAFVGHKEAVQELPTGCTHLVAGEACPYQMIRYGQNVYATQFHPEADGDVFALRIRIYRDKGYFAPEDADHLAAAARLGNPEGGAMILKNFVARYS
jgi:GMP synthase (glutamine-hydrolysing)